VVRFETCFYILFHDNISVTMSDVYVCNWADCVFEGKKKQIVWHVTLTHVPEERVPFHCTLCKYRGRNLRALQRHVTDYRPHEEKMNVEDDVNANYLVVSQHPYFVNLGIDNNCDGILKSAKDAIIIEVETNEFDYIETETQTEENFQEYKELKAEFNVLKGTHAAEQNKLADHLVRVQNKLSNTIKEKDDAIRILERKLRHKDNEIEELRRKLRQREHTWIEQNADDEPSPKRVKSVVKRLF